MKPNRLADRSAASVTVGLLEGQTRTGRLAQFSPYSPNLILEAEQGRRALIQVEHVAFVAFLKDKSAPSGPPSSSGSTHYKIHVAGGLCIAVEVNPSELENALGFYAKPLDPDVPFREVFFYAHGVNAKERDERIGDMLIAAGVLPVDALARGLSAHTAQRNARIGDILVEQQKVAPESIEEAAQLQKRKRMRLGEVLVEAGLVTSQDIEAALAEQKNRKGRRLGQVLIDMGILSEKDLATTLAKKFSMPFVDLDQITPNPVAMTEVSTDLVKKYGFVPLDMDERSFTVAIGDPLATEIHDVLRFQLKRRIVEVLATPTQLQKHAEKVLASIGNPDAMGLILKELYAGAETEEQEELLDSAESESATIKLANQLIIDAFKRGASDIHVEPNGKERPTSLRFRIDGDCVPYQQIQPAYRGPLVARLKIMAKLDISERRKPQDGKIRFRMADREIELRVATIPTVNGNEDVVMRILAASKPMPLEKMGMSQRNLQALQEVISKPYGLILCVGPTGSGKTTTLHAALGAINTPDMKIWTAEDPVEITQPGLRQVQVNPKIGFNFAAAMRSFLRADPDVIMIGEMRDHETAAIAIEASLTGHLVFSTLHTNTAPETITRLLDMGLDPFSFADALLGVLAQRLARGLCQLCREPYTGSEQEYKQIADSYGRDLLVERLGVVPGPDFTLWRGKGCETCGGTGYRGRIALHELLTSDPEVRALVQRRSPVEELRRVAIRAGMTTLLQDGIEKALAGRTDLKQVLAVCSR